VRRFLRLTALGTALAVAGFTLYIWFTLPPRAAALPALPATIALGAYHVHSSRSDGSSSVDDIAAAAARTGLKFVIFADHGDAVRAPDRPAYRHGVLCIDAVEVSTASGHLVVLKLDRASEYPLGGEARDVVEDVHRMGGWAVAAHPDSPRDELRWRAGIQGIDALEWLSVDSEWRDESPARLLTSVARALLRPAGTIASLFSPPARALFRWDAASRGRAVGGLAASDAHTRYDAVFRTVAQAVVLDRPLGAEAGDDARRVLEALTAGRTYSIVRAFADPGALDFAADANGVRVPMGASIETAGATLRAHVPGVADATVAIVLNGQQVATGKGSATSVAAVPGVYRAEAYYPGFAFPWIVSSPIRVELAPAPTPDPAPSQSAKYVAVDAGPWSVEKERTSTGTATTGADGVRFEFRLGAGQPSGQYAALVTAPPGDVAIDRVRFLARADRPMRLSVQVRTPGGPEGRRWRRSVYLDSTPRQIDLALAQLDPVGPATSLRPIAARVQSVLFVVDTVNTLPGTGGTVWIAAVQLGVGEAGTADGPSRR
jgi:hypothetical protein